jgi:hypothetical protein
VSRDHRLVKDARLNLEFAVHRARASGVREEQLSNDSAVRAAGERLTEAQANEHLQLIRTRLDAKRKKQNENDAHPGTI